jgi:monofunctional biosynthetic peptidoglycan transglycosylase
MGRHLALGWLASNRRVKARDKPLSAIKSSGPAKPRAASKPQTASKLQTTPRSRAGAKPAAGPKRGGLWRFLGRLLGLVVILAIVVPPASVLVYRFVPPPITILMIERLIQGHGLDYRWTPLSRMAPVLADAAVASEDSGFCDHHGFDFDAMEKAMRNNERRPNRIKGGSTISQQTAKNVFLWPGRSYLRKGVEAWYTVLIEAVWGKRRIMEMYLNVVEFGPGVYGAEAASEHFFRVHASQLNAVQAARLIAVLPKPLKANVTGGGRYVAKRSRRIDGAIGTVREDGLADCVAR